VNAVLFHISGGIATTALVWFYKCWRNRQR